MNFILTTSNMMLMNLMTLATLCCTTCNRRLQSAIFDHMFFPNLAGLLLILGVVAVALWGIIRAYSHHHNRTAQPGFFVNPVPLLRASLFLGVGIGGFVDGILFHQILQWHQMFSNKLSPITALAKSINMFWDGIFHAGMLFIVVLGVGLLWKVGRQQAVDTSARILAAGFLIGWGVFNVVEGVIDHHILELHNVRDVTVNPSLWNYGFLVLSALLVAIGSVLLRTHVSAPVKQS